MEGGGTPKLRKERGNKERRRGRKEECAGRGKGMWKAQNPEHGKVRELQAFLERLGTSGLVVESGVSYPSGKKIQKKEWSLSAGEQARLLRGGDTWSES